MPDKNQLTPSPVSQVLKDIPRPQKIAVIALALLAVLIVVFWVLQLQAQLTRPFGPSDSELQKNSAATVDSRLQDTDKDGLSDYDEINVYKTSSYLEDTDSDGLLDKAEIEAGTDPTCPKGKNCGAPTETVTNNSGSIVDSLASSALPVLSLPSSTLGTGVDTTALQGILDGGADVTTVRQILLQSGISQEVLDKISDEELMKSYQETLKNQNKQ